MELGGIQGLGELPLNMEQVGEILEEVKHSDGRAHEGSCATRDRSQTSTSDRLTSMSGSCLMFFDCLAMTMLSSWDYFEDNRR